MKIYMKAFLRYEKPPAEELAELSSYVLAQAKTMIRGRSEEDYQDLVAKFLSEGLARWRRAHREELLPLGDEDLLKRFGGAVRGFLFDERDRVIQETKGPVCDAGMIADPDAVEEEKDPFPQLKALPDLEQLEQMAEMRTLFQRALESHLPAGEWTSTEGTPSARLLARVLRDVSTGERTADDALEVLSVVLEANELRFKERSKRVAWFLGVLDEFENPELYTEHSPVTVYPSCGLSEAPTIESGLTERELAKAKGRLAPKQGELAEIFAIGPTAVPEMKKRRASGVDASLEAERMLEEALVVLETRKSAILERFEAFLMRRFGF